MSQTLFIQVFFVIIFCNDALSISFKARSIYDLSDSQNANILAVGDWGGIPFHPYYSSFELVTANRIMKIATEEKVDFALALGDNFYFDGVKNEHDPRFKTTFENVFGNPSFLHVPWYVLAGNHDHNGNITAEIEYSKHSSRWIYPSLWYSIEVQRANFNMTIVMIDTVMLCGDPPSGKMGAPPSGVDESMVAEQLSFIETKLKHNQNHYVLVAGHYPVWSVAEHGPTQCLIDKVKPMLEKYNVSAYVCGHDHTLQHIHEAGSSVEYILSGAVAVIDPSTEHTASIPPHSLRFYWANLLGLGGFATLSATSQSMTLKFYSGTGSLLYKYAILPRK